MTGSGCVIGVDSALSRTGLAVIEYNGAGCLARTWVIATETPTDTGIDVEYRRITSIVSRAAATLPKTASLAVIEAPALDADFGNAWNRAAVWWWIVGLFVQRGVPVARVAPATLKKWCTGSGGSAKHPVPKGRIVQAMHGMWPGLSATSNELRHHECEALGLAQIGAQRLGWPVPVRRHHGESLAVIKWPVGLVRS